MKALVVLLCYALSGLAPFFVFVALPGFRGPGGAFVLIVWLAALLAHHRMSTAWVENRRLGKGVSYVALTLGLLGFFALPLAAVIWGRTPVAASDVTRVILIEFALVSPATALAIYLNWYHASAAPEGGRNA